MKLYIANAWDDWGQVYKDAQVRASSFKVAANKAGYFAQVQARRRGTKNLTIKLHLVGTIKKVEKLETGPPSLLVD